MYCIKWNLFYLNIASLSPENIFYLQELPLSISHCISESSFDWTALEVWKIFLKCFSDWEFLSWAMMQCSKLIFSLAFGTESRPSMSNLAAQPRGFSTALFRFSLKQKFPTYWQIVLILTTLNSTFLLQVVFSDTSSCPLPLQLWFKHFQYIRLS